MLSRSDDEFRNFQNYTRLLDCDRNNFIKPNGIDQFENSDSLNAYIIQDQYVMNPEVPAEDYTALNVNNPAEIAYGCKIPEGYNSLTVDNLNENFSNKLNWPQGPNPFLIQDEFNQFDYPYNSYLNNLYESQAFERNIEEVPPQTLLENPLAFNPQLNINNFYSSDPGYYCPNPMEYPQGTFPPNPLINPRSLALAAQNPQIPPGVDPIPTTNFNQTLDNIPSSAPIPLSKYTKLSKNSLNPPFVMSPLNGNGMNQHYRLPPNHPSQKYFHYVNGNRIPPNIKDMYRKAGSTSSLVSDIATSNPLAINDSIVTDSTLNNARNFAIPSTSTDITKQVSIKAENSTTKVEKSENSIKPALPVKLETSVTKEDSSTSKDVATTLSTSSTSSIVKSEIEVSKVEVDVKAPIKLEEVKKEGSVVSTSISEPIKAVITPTTTTTTVSTVETNAVNGQTNVTNPAVTAKTAPVDNLKAVQVNDTQKPTVNSTNTSITTTKSQNNNNVTTANGAVRVRKRHQVKVACVNCRKACKKCDEARPCARCIKMDLCATCVDGERKPREKGVRRGPYKRQKQLQQQQQNQNSTNDPKATTSTKTNDKDGIQKTRQKKKKTQKQLKQEVEAENATTANKSNIINPLQVSNSTVNALQAPINIANPLQVQNTEAQLLQTTLSQDPTMQLTQPTADLLNGTPSYNEFYGLYGNDSMYLNYYNPDLYYCPNPLNSYSYPMSENYVLPPEKVTSSLEECESFYKINTESTSSPSATNTTVNTIRGTPNDKLINLSSNTADVLSAISSTTALDSTEI